MQTESRLVACEPAGYKWCSLYKQGRTACGLNPGQTDILRQEARARGNCVEEGENRTALSHVNLPSSCRKPAAVTLLAFSPDVVTLANSLKNIIVWSLVNWPWQDRRRCVATFT